MAVIHFGGYMFEPRLCMYETIKNYKYFLWSCCCDDSWRRNSWKNITQQTIRSRQEKEQNKVTFYFIFLFYSNAVNLNAHSIVCDSTKTALLKVLMSFITDSGELVVLLLLDLCSQSWSQNFDFQAGAMWCQRLCSLEKAGSNITVS